MTAVALLMAPYTAKKLPEYSPAPNNVTLTQTTKKDKVVPVHAIEQKTHSLTRAEDKREEALKAKFLFAKYGVKFTP